MIAGRISDFRPEAVRRPVSQKPSFTVSPRPNDGSQPSSTENSQISKTPIRNVGSDTPMSEVVITKPARKPPRLIAVKMPRRMPAASAISADMNASSSVAGSREAIRSATGSAVR